jgi:hypothetical protein
VSLDLEAADKVPLYRFLVLPGHEFQNYPCDTIKLTSRKPNLNVHKSIIGGRNIVKWILAPKSYLSHKTIN